MSPPVYDIWNCIFRIICYPKLQILWKCWLQAQLFLIPIWSIRVKFKKHIKPQLRNIRTLFNYDPVLAWQVLSFQSHCHIDWEVDPPPKATNKHRVIRFVKYATDAFYVGPLYIVYIVWPRMPLMTHNTPLPPTHLTDKDVITTVFVVPAWFAIERALFRPN